MNLHRYAVPAVFGATDGLVVALGVMMPLLTRPTALILAGAGAAVAEGVGMAAAEWLSDSVGGWRESGALGVATAGASITPVLPFLVLPDRPAGAVAGMLILALALGIAAIRHRVQVRPWRRALGETFGILALVALCVGVCVVALGAA